jgi:hypothetical protein
MLAATAFCSRTTGGFSGYEAETERYRETREFSVWLNP